MTTSLALLPSPSLRDCSSTQQPILNRPQASGSPKRPKLSLNTHAVNSFGGKKSTSLCLNTLSAVSPTIRNTFSNGYEPKADESTSSSPPSSASSLSTDSTDSSSSLGAEKPVPYTVAYNLTSILSNSPIKPLRPKMSRPFFPATKRVSFRVPLEEEIKNTKYTASHMDLCTPASSVSSLDTLDSEISLDSTSSAETDDDMGADQSSDDESVTARNPRGAKRNSWSDDEDSDDSCAQTPIASRNKRRREWVWTLPDPAKTNDSSESQQ